MRPSQFCAVPRVCPSYSRTIRSLARPSASSCSIIHYQNHGCHHMACCDMEFCAVCGESRYPGCECQQFCSDGGRPGEGCGCPPCPECYERCVRLGRPAGCDICDGDCRVCERVGGGGLLYDPDMGDEPEFGACALHRPAQSCPACDACCSHAALGAALRRRRGCARPRYHPPARTHTEPFRCSVLGHVLRQGRRARRGGQRSACGRDGCGGFAQAMSRHRYRDCRRPQVRRPRREGVMAMTPSSETHTLSHSHTLCAFHRTALRLRIPSHRTPVC